MKVNTNKVVSTTISLTTQEAVQQVTENFLDILEDSIKDGIDTVLEQAELLAKVLKMIKENRWIQLFSEGWAPLVLSREAMDALDAHYEGDGEPDDEKITIIIHAATGYTFAVRGAYISY